MTRQTLLALIVSLGAGCVAGTSQPASLPAELPSAAPVTSDNSPAPADPAVTPAPSVTASPIPSPSVTASAQPSATATASPSGAPSPSPTSTPTPSPSPTAMAAASPTPKPPVVSSMTVQPQSSQYLTMTTASTLELDARIAADTVTGSNACMVVYLNSQVIRQAPTNRATMATTAGGQQITLFDTVQNAWTLWFSPDYKAAGLPTAGNLQVTTDSAQAQRYVWNVAAQQGQAATMTLRIENLGQGGAQQPIHVQVTQR